MEALRETVARLAAGAQGRTEADVQADVRRFLLDASLSLAPAQVLDVTLEAPAGGGRRIDVEAGFAAIEVKKNLASDAVRKAAVDQLSTYVSLRTEERAQRYVGVLTDGRLWMLFHLRPDGDLAEVSRLELGGGGDVDRLAAWLEVILATTEKVKPTPKEIQARLGAASPAAQLDLADLRALYQACRAQPEVQLKRELWARLLLSALGTNFDNSDELFVTHTYLVLTAELVAHQVMDISIEVPDGDVRALLEGQRFAVAGIHGVVEADFFDWPATAPQGRPIIAGIARRLSTFDWRHVEHDVLKALYVSVIDAETRKRLGEYYTPDWLAEKMVEEHFREPLQQRLLDPACGSGTFLFWAVRRLLDACDAAGIPNREALERVVRQVQGVDLHPVAVTLARVTYLLALTPDRLADRDELTVPVFLGDSVRWEQDETVLTEGGMTVRTSQDLELFDDELHFPEGVVEDPQRFDRLVAALAGRAADRRAGTKPPTIVGLLNAHHVVGSDDREAVTTAFKKLCRLHDAGRDHVWSYYIRNLARPLALARVDGRADVLVGNPPWLAYRSMPAKLQKQYRTLAEHRGLWAGGKVATNQDLSDLFVARAVEQYLKPGGVFGFVMPFAVLSRRQFAGFRSGEWSVNGGPGAVAEFKPPSSFAKVKPPLFSVPACVVSGVKAGAATPLPSESVSWAGRVPNHYVGWAAAALHLRCVAAGVATATDVAESPYRAAFRQGATIVPRVLHIVERVEAGSLGITAGRIAIRSARSSIEKPPWKALRTMPGVVEEQFVRPLHNGSSIVAFREREPELAVIPWIDGQLLDGLSERLDEFPGLAAWWRKAEAVYERHKSPGSNLSLVERINFQRLLARQMPVSEHRVVYSASGQYLAACRIEDPRAIVEHKLYWAPVAGANEGRYICAILNSQVLADVVAPLQSHGQHNPRDFDMHVFALPFPAFDSAQDLHVRLAALAARAERVAADLDLPTGWRFQKARRVTREALRADGVGVEIDVTVGRLLSEAIESLPAGEPHLQAPDLMGKLSAAIRDAETALRSRTGVKSKPGKPEPANPRAVRRTPDARAR